MGAIAMTVFYELPGIDCEGAGCIWRGREGSQHTLLNKHFISIKNGTRIPGQTLDLGLQTLPHSHDLRAQNWRQPAEVIQGTFPISGNCEPTCLLIQGDLKSRNSLPEFPKGELLVCWPTFQTWGKYPPAEEFPLLLKSNVKVKPYFQRKCYLLFTILFWVVL